LRLESPSPFDTSSDLLAEFTELTQSDQGAIATTSGGELLDVGNNSGNTVEAAIITVGLDLIAAFAKVPATAKAGKPLTVTFIVTNGSDASEAADGNLPIEVESSPDGVIADGVELKTLKKKINLKPGKSLRLAFAGKLSSSAYVIVLLDPGAAAFPDNLNAANNAVITGEIVVS
jgi:hypothetical protein